VPTGFAPLLESDALGPDLARIETWDQFEETVDVHILRRWICAAFLLVLVFASLVMLFVYCWAEAILATLRYGELPCDVPLSRYVWIQLCIWWVVTSIRAQPQDSEGAVFRVMSTVGANTMGLLVLGAGYAWIVTSRTCQQTNPMLYQAVKHLLYFQTAWVVFSFTFYAGAMLLLRWAALDGFDLDPTLEAEPRRSCEEAVFALPKVPLNAQELLDPEDGRPTECAVCSEEHSAAVGLVVVRTRCEHHFHEVCLARWCREHSSCPICRAGIGDGPSSVT